MLTKEYSRNLKKKKKKLINFSIPIKRFLNLSFSAGDKRDESVRFLTDNVQPKKVYGKKFLKRHLLMPNMVIE